MTALTAGQGKAGSAATAARRVAAWVSSEAVRHALRVALAMVIAFYISLSLGWERPAWAGLAVAICSLSTTGESVNKGLLRILGTLLAGSVALLLNALFPQDRWAYLLSATTYIGFCTYMMGHSTRWYVWFIGGYVMALLALAGGPEGAASFEIVVLRLQQTTLGVITYTVVAMLLWPQRRSPVLRQSAGSLMDMHRRLLGHGFAVLRGDPEDPGVTKLRAQASAGAAGLPEVIDGAELDSLDVWDARRLWRRFAGDAAALNEALERRMYIRIAAFDLLSQRAWRHSSDTRRYMQDADDGSEDGWVRIRRPEDFEIGYRQVRGPAGEWFLSALLQLQHGRGQLRGIHGPARRAMADVGVLAEHACQVASAEEDGPGATGATQARFLTEMGAVAGNPGPPAGFTYACFTG